MRTATPRFFVEHPAIAWALLGATLAWGVWGYHALPRHKDPEIVVPVAGVSCPWPGHRAAEVERELTVRLEKALAEDPRLTTIQSVSRDHGAGLRLAVDERVDDTAAVFDAAEARLSALTDLPPGAGPLAMVRDFGDTAALLLAVAPPVDGRGEPLYSPGEIDRFSARLAAALARTDGVAAVRRVGVAEERVFADLDLARLAARGLDPAGFLDTLEIQPLPAAGARPDPALVKVFGSAAEIGHALLGLSLSGPVTLAEVARIHRGPEAPPRQPVFLGRRDARGTWQRTPAVVLDVQRRAAAGIDRFGAAVERTLAAARRDLPADLLLVRIADQVRQVDESLALFLRSLVEAVLLVVLVALVGFRDRRAALLLALSIPLTLALTFGLLALFGIDLQQVSTASLILALGLLVDDPVVASDAIAVELAAGRTATEAAWRGPCRLSRAILFATLTNIVAYLPLLLLSGNIGRFLYSLPVVLTCSLVASRFVSMTFVPLLGAHLLRAPAVGAVRRRPDLRAFYLRTGARALAHRRALLAAALLLLLPGAFLARTLPTQFFPRDLSHLAYVDLWLPAGSRVEATTLAAAEADATIGRTAAGGIDAVATFVGRAAPRFWFALDPQPPQARYAQLVLTAGDEMPMRQLAEPLQAALDAGGGEALADVRPLEIGKPVGVPVQIRIAGDDLPALRRAADEVARLLAALPGARRVRSDWPELTGDGAAPGGLDPRLAAAVEMGGLPLGVLAEGARFLPVLARIDETALAGLSARLAGASPPAEAAAPPIAALVRRDQRRTVTVACFPAPGVLASQVLAAAQPELARLAARLGPGLRLAIGGEDEEQRHAFGELALVLAVSVALIFAALLVQFRSVVQPLLVFAALPFGALGAVAALRLTGQPFGFMAFLGVASLLGVIVSHVIVLFDGIEEARRAGAPLESALLEAGLARLRPVLITVAATIFALVPLAHHGGPLWRALCYAQIGGLGLATLVTLVLVPLLYALAVRDLGWIPWPEQPRAQAPALDC